MLKTLYARLALSVLALVAVLGSAIIAITQYTSELYSQEVTQRLNAAIAMYVTDAQQLIVDGKVDQGAMDLLANRAMTINPTVEIYILSPAGEIISHVMEPDALQRNHVAMQPLQQFLNGATLPIFGDDPRHLDTTKVFSVSPIVEQGETAGYLYAVLGGKKYDSIRAAVQSSFILTTGLFAIVGSLAIALLVALVLFFVLTRRLSQLRQQMEQFNYNQPVSFPVLQTGSQNNDEIDQLTRAFMQMATRIHEQYLALRHMDETRRELIANVSHDLRTPLASMQGYIETLLIKKDEFNAEDKKRYLEIAYKHSQRLNKLIAELFELAKLDSGAAEIKAETFSLTELAHDCVQSYELQSAEQRIQLKIQAPAENLFVHADIAMIQRVLQNLLDNALRHTPAGNEIYLVIDDSREHATIEVRDTGQGIAGHEIPHIFERFFHSKQQDDSREIGSGLGLAIVKRILDLHQTSIRVKSELERGTSFVFDLPLHRAVA